MQQQSPFINSERWQRQRSSSKKKGISVSLTPSKNQEMNNNFNVSRVQVSKINELPFVGYHSNFFNGVNNINRINFSYQSPAGSNISQQQSKRQQKSIHSQIAIESVIKKQSKLIQNYPNNQTISPSKMFYNVQLKTQQITRQNLQKGQQIRSNVFNIVEQIASKVQKNKKDKKQVLDVNLKKQVIQKDNYLNELVHKKVTKKKQIIKQKQQNHLEMIAECTLQTSDQLIKVNNNEITHDKALKPNAFNQNKNYQYLLKEQQRKRLARFKKAQQNLLNIIKVCDYGL